MKVNFAPVNNFYEKQVHKEPVYKQAFKGYDARPLKAVVMTVCDDPKSFDIIKQFSKIGKIEGFKVYFVNQKKAFCANLDKIKKFFEPEEYVNGYTKWVQDYVVLTPHKKLLSDGIYQKTKVVKTIENLSGSKHELCPHLIDGGNLFFVKNGGQNELFVGAEGMFGKNIEAVKKTYGVSKVHIIPQADFHLDLFIRPLNNKRVLVADDKLTIKEISAALRNIKKLINKNDCTQVRKKQLLEVEAKLTDFLKEFRKDVKNLKNPDAAQIASCLEHKGFSPIRVPGRIYYRIPAGENRDDLVHSMNYMNAVVHERADGALCYVTNKSELNEIFGITPEISEEIGFDFEKMFIKCLEPYVKKEKIYFIEGRDNKMADLLEEESGALHCLSNEIPAEFF
ncbi:MAG: hypothetical protein KHX03_06120 [Clostridium sp.]|nr:hypothetical protein [Clostridium sp.]